MGSKWRKVKMALGSNLCVYVPAASDESPPSSDRASDAVLLSPATDWSVGSVRPASPRFLLSRSLSRSSKKTCTICLGSMKRGEGQAIFTAECSHSFHFQCIASSVKHGNQVCPVCRAKWKEVPVLSPILDQNQGQARVSPVNWAQDNDRAMTLFRQLPTPRSTPNRHANQLFQSLEPNVFNDDEPLDRQRDWSEEKFSNESSRRIIVKTYPEVGAVLKSDSRNDFTVLIHVRAPGSESGLKPDTNRANLAQVVQTPRAPVDLVTTLDISGSMAGTKLALLKRAMGFVIQNLGPADRLAVVAFSSTARRIFPLRRMSDLGKQQALQAVNSLIANGGTNIVEGLKKGAKVMEERRERNPVASIILLSDGQDTYTVTGENRPNYQLLIPRSMLGDNAFKIPVHAFGFGTDHDALSMHSISEISGGTFSFIETEGVIQDAFAQCIGGLLSVMVKSLQVVIETVHPAIRFDSLKAGSYKNSISSDRRTGKIEVGDLYADEERDFLVSLNIPRENSDKETRLLKVKCAYNDPLTKEGINLESEEVRIRRPENNGGRHQTVSIKVDRQRNRVQAAEAMVQARTAAEGGDLTRAISILETFRKKLAESVSAKSNDRLCVSLDAEIKEMQERMASRHVYEASGRAYILSGLSSHSWQRATARGDSTEGSSLIQAYQTPLMVEMLSRSQATLLGSPSGQRLLRPFGWQAKPR